MTSLNNARVEIFRKIRDQLNADPPTYTHAGTVYTYTIVASFPEADPTFPCIVVNPIEKRTMKLGVAKRPNVTMPASIDIDFYAKVSHGKNAIDSARDKVEMILRNNWITESVTINTDVPSQEVSIQGVE